MSDWPPIVLLLLGAVAGSTLGFLANLAANRINSRRNSVDLEVKADEKTIDEHGIVIRDLSRWVLPAFMPGRDGSTGHTIPNRLGKLDEGQQSLEVAQSAFGVRLDAHLVAEEGQNGTTVDQLAASKERMSRIESTLSDTLAQLAAGNPEVRP